MNNIHSRLWIAFLMLYPVVALAQDSAVSKLFRRDTGGTQTITIDVPATRIPKPVEFNNGTEVTIRVPKQPPTTCVVATKREELKPEPNPIAQFLKIVTGIGPFAFDFQRDVMGLRTEAEARGVQGRNPNLICPNPDDLVVPGDAEARQVERSIGNLRESLLRSSGDLEEVRKNYQATTKGGLKLASCQNNLCDSAGAFNSEKDRLGGEIETLLSTALPTLESTELQIASLKKVLSDRYKTPGGQDEANWIKSVNQRLDCLVGVVESLKQVREALAAVRADLEKFRNLLVAHQTSFEFSKKLPADNNAKITGTVTCSNFFTKQPIDDPVPFTVTYQNLPWATVSAGIVISSLNKRQIGTQPIRTGTAPDGTPTFRVAFAETDTANSQIVPFSFFNFYLSGTRKLNLNLTGGIGLNPNNGSNQVEFFVGGALGFKNLYLHLGGHAGRWQELGGGFAIGETVPDKFPAVPIGRRYSMKPAIGISYRLPLP